MIMDDTPLPDLAFRFYLPPKPRARENTETNCLCVGQPLPDPAMLNKLEANYRQLGLAPCIFEETADDGSPIFGNAVEYAGLMNLPPDAPLPSMERAQQWAAEQTWAGWTRK
jgi:hypothetical protein